MQQREKFKQLIPKNDRSTYKPYSLNSNSIHHTVTQKHHIPG